MNPRSRAFVLTVAAALAAALLAGCSDDQQGSREENVAQEPAQAPQSIPENEPVARVAAQVEPSVVQVNVRDIQTTPFGPQAQEGVGSGVIYRSDGYIITNDHVIAGADQVNVAFADGTTLRGEVVGEDPRTDIAVVKVDRDNLPAASFSDSDDLLVGQLAVAIGSPSGFESTVTAGVISGLNREIPPQITGGVQVPSLVDLIQTDAAISPGSSGGALANRSGEVIGINVAYLPPQTGAVAIGFAIPSTTATEVADQLIESGEVSSPYIGIGLSDLTPRIAEQFGLSVESGVLVTEVGRGTPADEAGLQQGDIVTEIDGERVEDTGDLLGALRDYRPGDTVDLTVVRGGEERAVSVTLAERPERG